MSELKELLERFRRGPEVVAVATTGASGPQLDYQPEPGSWSVRQIVWHLAEAEMVGAMRFRQVIAEENPTIQGYDQNAWTAGLGYEKRRFSPGLELFRKVRTENYELMASLPEETFARIGTHTERGQLTLLDLLRIYAEHAESHARQIMNNRQAYKASKTTV